MSETKYMTTITAISIHPEGESPVFGDNATTVTLDDDGAGCFIVLAQPGAPGAEVGKVRLNPEEFPLILAAVDQLMKQDGAKE